MNLKIVCVQAGVQNSYFRLGDEARRDDGHLTHWEKIRIDSRQLLLTDDNNLLSLLFDKPDGKRVVKYPARGDDPPLL
jgi:hypothetical protein